MNWIKKEAGEEDLLSVVTDEIVRKDGGRNEVNEDDILSTLTEYEVEIREEIRRRLKARGLRVR